MTRVVFDSIGVVKKSILHLLTGINRDFCCWGVDQSITWSHSLVGEGGYYIIIMKRFGGGDD